MRTLRAGLFLAAAAATAAIGCETDPRAGNYRGNTHGSIQAALQTPDTLDPAVATGCSRFTIYNGDILCDTGAGVNDEFFLVQGAMSGGPVTKSNVGGSKGLNFPAYSGNGKVTVGKPNGSGFEDMQNCGIAAGQLANCQTELPDAFGAEKSTCYVNGKLIVLGNDGKIWRYEGDGASWVEIQMKDSPKGLTLMSIQPYEGDISGANLVLSYFDELKQKEYAFLGAYNASTAEVGVVQDSAFETPCIKNGKGGYDITIAKGADGNSYVIELCADGLHVSKMGTTSNPGEDVGGGDTGPDAGSDTTPVQNDADIWSGEDSDAGALPDPDADGDVEPDADETDNGGNTGDAVGDTVPDNDLGPIEGDADVWGDDDADAATSGDADADGDVDHSDTDGADVPVKDVSEQPKNPIAEACKEFAEAVNQGCIVGSRDGDMCVVTGTEAETDCDVTMPGGALANFPNAGAGVQLGTIGKQKMVGLPDVKTVVGAGLNAVNSSVTLSGKTQAITGDYNTRVAVNANQGVLDQTLVELVESGVIKLHAGGVAVTAYPQCNGVPGTKVELAKGESTKVPACPKPVVQPGADAGGGGNGNGGGGNGGTEGGNGGGGDGGCAAAPGASNSMGGKLIVLGTALLALAARPFRRRKVEARVG